MRTFGALLLLVSLGFSAACAENLVTDIVTQEISYYTGLSIGLIVLIITFAYMIGTSTNNAQLLIFSKDEMFHLGISLILITSIGGILFFSCIAVSGFLDFALSTLVGGTSDCYDGTQSAVNVARCYIATLEEHARAVLAATTRDSIRNEMESATIFGFYNPVTGGIMTPTKGEYKTYAMQLDMVGLTFVLPALVSISLQRIFLNFGIDFVRYLIPVALFFRIFPGIRNMGNLLLALSIAVYIFIPSMYAINAAMDDAVFQSTALGCTAGSRTEALVEDVVMGDCDSLYNFWSVARLLPQAFFLPNLTIAITITFLSGVNKALRVLT
ncbi:MAG TPA: hypothetical protein VJH24_05875 [Candidatus Bilamarchaeaceae archaeon]|nr:hypothetical protein [Candidatus Bilamarchaeaceae archaeon]